MNWNEFLQARGVTDADLNDEQVKGYKKLVPLRRFGKPSEVADAVMFLASDKAAYITGSVLDINGGI